MPPNEYLFLRPNTDFQHFGNQHFEMMALTLVLAIGLAIFAK